MCEWRVTILHRTEYHQFDGFPATQSNRTHSQITQLVESHDWANTGKVWTTLEG